MNKKNITKEFLQIEDALNAYYAKYNGNIIINVSVCAFDKQGEVINDNVWLWGVKENLLMNNEDMLEKIQKYH